MLALHTQGTIAGPGSLPPVAKILTLEEALKEDHWIPDALIDQRQSTSVAEPSALVGIGVGGLLVGSPMPGSPLPQLHSLRAPEVVKPGDVIRIQPSGKIQVLFRRGANANSLFVTERCNSNCIMCSQPPVDSDDRWRLSEFNRLISLIDPTLDFLGVTGGEPTLLGDDLLNLLHFATAKLPATTFHILTNGRLFEDERYAKLFRPLRGKAVWAIPLYGCTPHSHDFVVQSGGAFASTLHGLMNLGEDGHRIELRCVLVAQTARKLPLIAEFIQRNLPFVEHIAFMGVEPMGFARGNRELIWIDPQDFSASLVQAVRDLDAAGLSVSVYNLPLCVLDRELWPFARRSISDWKNVYTPECDRCSIQEQCGGIFRSTDPNWRGRTFGPIAEGVSQ